MMSKPIGGGSSIKSTAAAVNPHTEEDLLLRCKVTSGAVSLSTTMVPPVAVSPLIKTARYSALIAGIIYGKQRYEYLKPLGAEDKRIAEEEKKALEEKIRIAKEIEANQESILK
ncbi:ATP synthase subunit e, mitochondrial [Dissostichus eleginoides]|nr:ATP synthase subunit e, mitochondrial [Dissostichus eleginoides]